MSAEPVNRRELQESKEKLSEFMDALDSIDEKESPKKKTPNPYVLHVYRRLYTVRQVLRKIDPKISRANDRLLASIGYPAKLISFLTGSVKLASLSGVISDVRTFARLVQTPHTLEWALDLLLDNKNPDLLDRWGDYLQAVSGVLYQVLEDIAYLAGKGVLPVSVARQNDFWVVSCMFWAVHVAIELLRAPYYHYVLHKPVNFRNFFVNLAWAPLTYHWSTYTGAFNEGWVGLLGTMACWPNLAYQWQL